MLSMNLEFQIKGIGQVSIRVKDMEVATRFYQDTLGLNLLFEIPNMAFFYDPDHNVHALMSIVSPLS